MAKRAAKTEEREEARQPQPTNEDEGVLESLGFDPDLSHGPEPEDDDLEEPTVVQTGRAEQPEERGAREEREEPVTHEREEPAAREVAERTEEAPTVEQLRAQLQEREAAWDRERQGLLNSLIRQRQQRQVAEAGQQAPREPAEEPEPQERIPVDVDSRGRATVDPRHLRQHLPAPAQADPYQQVRDRLVMQDPATRGPAVSQLESAYQYLDQLTLSKVMETGIQPTSMDEMLDFVESQGLLRQAQERFPDELPDLNTVEDLIQARVYGRPRPAERVLSRYLSRRGSNGGHPGGPAPATDPATSQRQTAERVEAQSRVASRPRSMVDRGERAHVSREARLDELANKDLFDPLTTEERHEYLRLMQDMEETS